MADWADEKAGEVMNCVEDLENLFPVDYDALQANIAAALREARTAEREQCARVVEATTTFAEARGIISDDATVRECAQHTGKACDYVRQRAAAAIRAREG